MNVPELLTTKEAAAVLRRSWRTLEKWRAEQTGPPWVKLDGRPLYRAEDLTAYITDCVGRH